MQRSPIEWTDFTANPLRYRDSDGNVVHACIHKSGGCLHCYAEVLAGRWGRAGKKFTAENMKRLTPFLDEKELHHMLTYKPAAGKKCFVGDMTDIFGEWVPDELISQLFAVFCLRPDVHWQLLTKRPEHMRTLLSDEDFASEVDAFAWEKVEELVDPLDRRSDDIRATAQSIGDGPLKNVWLGVSVEDQKTADERIPLLLQIPAAIRFVSYEPALGPMDFTKWLSLESDKWPYTDRHDHQSQERSEGRQSPRELGIGNEFGAGAAREAGSGEMLTGESEEQQREANRGDSSDHSSETGCRRITQEHSGGLRDRGQDSLEDRTRPTLDWLICGGESGPSARPFNIQWARDVIAQCKAAGVACFVKQLGTYPHNELYGYTDKPLRLLLKDRKGGDWSEWPEGLRVREWPKQEVGA